MIVKEKKYRHRKKLLDKKQEKEISKFRRNKIVKEEVKVNEKVIEIQRPMFFVEAKEQYFQNQELT